MLWLDKRKKVTNQGKFKGMGGYLRVAAAPTWRNLLHRLQGSPDAMPSSWVTAGIPKLMTVLSQVSDQTHRQAVV